MIGYHYVNLGYREPATHNMRAFLSQLDKVEGYDRWPNPWLRTG